MHGMSRDSPSLWRYAAAGVTRRAGGVDVSFNMTSVQDVQGLELTAMSIDDYMRPMLSEVGDVAALVASDRAGPITGAAVNITCRRIID